MTPQPVSSSPSSSPYDVFLSFRGEDTRTNFTAHLHHALVSKGIHTFIDVDKLERGEEISQALVKAIEESRISLIVFSENYATSRWCLDELVKILQCKESKQQIVLPIFYKVDPEDVEKQTNGFGDAFKDFIEKKFKNDKEKELKWREALEKTTNLAAYVFKDKVDNEAKFIKNIVDGILKLVLSRTCMDVAKYPVGIQSHVQGVERHLDVGGNGRLMVGIWGTSGIGKTTIAKAIWNKIARKFEGSCFLENVREGSLIHLQETLLGKILGKNLKIQGVGEGIGVIKERLRHKKILLILDDVDQLEQLEKLAGDDWFGEGSRVIITTNDRGLLENRKIKLHEVKKLYYNQALELFSWHAFGRSEPPKDYFELAQRAIAFADALPLALQLLGSHLRNMSIPRWKAILNDYKGDPYTHIDRVLQKSYDALDDYAKGVFLDIACFFKGEKKDYVLQIVPQNCIEVLLDKAMITIEYWDDRILMHNLLAKLGKDIVHKESPNDPGKRSRLWFYKDVKRVLTENIGTRDIKGIIVKLPEPAEITLDPECFSNMINLEIFINHNASLCGHINYLPNALRLIDWDRCQLQSLPPKFQGNWIVVFNMPHSHIRQLDGFNFKEFPYLTSMNLSDCQSLEKIPDLSGIPNLKYLHLKNCASLVEVDDSVGLLDKLVGLYLERCVKLTRFGTRLRLKSLKELDLSYCKRLESFPEIEVEMKSLKTLDIAKSGVRELPSSFAYLKGLEVLKADYCENLTITMNSKLQLLPNLSRFSLMRSNLSKIDFLRPLGCWSTLAKLDLSENNFVILPISFSKLVNLETLYLWNCRSLREIPEQVLPRRVRQVELNNCTSLGKIPRMAWVLLDNCTSLEKIPELPRKDDHMCLSLTKCVRLCGNDITENIFLNQVSVSSPHSHFDISLPGDEVPKWFSCCKDATIVKFEIPANLKWETLRLVLCVFSKVEAKIFVNEKLVNYKQIGSRESQVYLTSIPLFPAGYVYKFEEPLTKQGNMCQVRLHNYGKVPAPDKIPCGVHLLGHQVADVSEIDVVDHGPTQLLLHDAMAVDDDFYDDQHQDCELLSLSLASKTSLGKRPRQSDYMALHDDHRANVVDNGDHEAQWLTLFTGPADHQKRRHIDLNEEPK